MAAVITILHSNVTDDTDLHEFWQELARLDNRDIDNTFFFSCYNCKKISSRSGIILFFQSNETKVMDFKIVIHGIFRRIGSLYYKYLFTWKDFFSHNPRN